MVLETGSRSAMRQSYWGSFFLHWRLHDGVVEFLHAGCCWSMLERVDNNLVVKCPRKISVHAALSVNCASFSMESALVRQVTPSRHGTRVVFPIFLARTEMALGRVLPVHFGIRKKMKGREREGSGTGICSWIFLRDQGTLDGSSSGWLYLKAGNKFASANTTAAATDIAKSRESWHVCVACLRRTDFMVIVFKRKR